MLNLDDITNESNKKHNEKWPFIPDYPYRILIIGDSGSGKTNALLNFSVPKDIRLKATHYLIMKINNKRELQNIATNHSPDIDDKDFVKIYRECTTEQYFILTIDTTLPASDPLRFRNNLLHSYKNDSN